MSTINKIINKIEEDNIQQLGLMNRWQSFNVGDNINVVLEVLGKDKKTTRYQRIFGRCIGMKNRQSTNGTFKLLDLDKKITYIFPIYSPDITVTVKTAGKARRAKLNYLKNKSRKEARIKVDDHQ